MPRLALVAFEDRTARHIFVAVPGERGRYVMTDRSVALVGCPQCHSVTGEPCRRAGKRAYGATTHYARRNLARQQYGTPLPGGDITDELEWPELEEP